MDDHLKLPADPKELVTHLIAELDALPEKTTAPMRRVRRKYSQSLRSQGAAYVLEVAQLILESGEQRWIADELIHEHPAAFQSLDREKLEFLGKGMNSWYSVDSFARVLSGPAWLEGLILIEAVRDWARSEDLWWRRAALVSTVALNIRTHGGYGDVDQTLEICEMLVDDREDMVVKALSWALRALVVHDPEAVERFLEAHQEELAGRVKREVGNKLKTGLKNP
jgi:3-methyladenine DNA glycosylase AlkD